MLLVNSEILWVALMANYWTNSHSLSKIVLFLIIWAVIWLPIALPLIKLIKWQTAAPTANTQKKLTLIFSLYFLVPFLTWGLMEIGEITLEQIGVIFQVRLFQSILFGYGLSVLTLSLIYLWEWGLNCVTFNQDFNILKNPSILLNIPLLGVVSLFIASIEELVFRGIFVNFLHRDYSIIVTAIISSLIFALLHLVWEQKNTIPQLPGLFILGVVLFYAVMVDNNLLGLAIGLHGGWVFGLAWVDTFDLVHYRSSFPAWIVGNREQPLGSIASIMALLLAMLIIFISDFDTSFLGDI